MKTRIQHEGRQFLSAALLLLMVLAAPALLRGQTVIGGTTPNPSALLDLQSTDKGFLPPRMTSAQRDAIPNPPAGLIIFNTTLNCIELNVGAPAAPDWRCLSFGLSAGDAAVLNEILEDSNSPGGANNANGIPVPLLQLQALPLTGVIPAYIGAYQQAINAETGFSNPPTVPQVQALINAVNAAINAVLAQIGNEGDDPDVINSVVTIAQLQSLPVTGVNPAHEIAYQNYIDNNPNSFSSPATVAEVQAMITAVNNAINGVLVQIGNEGDSPDVVNSVVTIAQLQSLPVTGVNPAYETAYQDYIDANPGLFSSPATVAEVQAMITAVNNAINTVLAQIGNEGDDPDVNNSVVTIAQLQSLPVTGVNPAYQTAYQDYIDANPNSFSSPATVAEVQAMITAVNAAVPTSGGIAVVSAYTCTTASAGTLTQGTAASGVTQTITATVTTVGTYNITATANGITFSGSGTFAGTGSQNIVLTASGTPTAAGTNSFTLNTTPGCSFNRTTDAPAGSIGALNCAGATNTGTLTAGVTASGVNSSVPYTGGNGGAHSGQTVTSTGVTGLTATLSAGSFASGAGSLTYTITGTPSGAGTASFALNIGGQTCTLTRTVQAIESLPAGSGSFTGETCFDIALSNDNTNNCAPLSSRTPRQANFTLPATHTQTYTFTPSGTVSNVRFVYSNTNGSVITNLTGGNSGNNITTAQTATVNYNTSLNTLALGLTNSNPLTATITVIYNDGATNNGTDRQFTLSVQVKDCACCGAATTTGGWLPFQCHNLGANTSVNPFTYSVGNADGSGGTLGHLYQWGRPADGHQLRNSATTSTLATSNTPGNSSFIITSTSDWRSGGGETTRWGDGTAGANPAKAANDPCPPGWKVPSQSQWGSIFRGGTTSGAPGTATANTWTWTGNGFRVGNSLYLPAAGGRGSSSGWLLNEGIGGYYWSSTVSGTSALGLGFGSVSVGPALADVRAAGWSVRCVPQ